MNTATKLLLKVTGAISLAAVGVSSAFAAIPAVVGTTLDSIQADVRSGRPCVACYPRHHGFSHPHEVGQVFRWQDLTCCRSIPRPAGTGNDTGASVCFSRCGVLHLMNFSKGMDYAAHLVCPGVSR